MEPAARTREAWAAAIIGPPLLVAVVVTLFAWPAARLESQDLPLGVAGPQQAVAAIEQRLAANKGAFEVRRYAAEEEARAAIEDREVYGAIVASPAGTTLLTASAASPWSRSC